MAAEDRNYADELPFVAGPLYWRLSFPAAGDRNWTNLGKDQPETPTGGRRLRRPRIATSICSCSRSRRSPSAMAEDRNNMDAENLFIHENNWRSSSVAAGDRNPLCVSYHTIAPILAVTVRVAEDRNNACKTLYLGGGAAWQAPLAAAENRNEFTQAYGVIAAATSGRRSRWPRIAT